MARLILGLILFYLLIVLLAYFFQRSLIYYPDQHTPKFKELGITDMQEVKLKTVDGLQLLSWYKRASPGQPTFIYFQGNAGNIANRAELVRPYLSKGYGVLLVGYRGYGGNPGVPSEQGFYQDAQATFSFLQNKRVPTRCIVLYGESLGSALAVQLAQQHSIGAIILLAPFTSMVDIGKYHYPIFPVSLFLKDRFDFLAKISAIKAPLLVILAEDDQVVPMQFGKRLYDAAPQPKELIIYPDVDHNDLHQLVQQKVIDFIQRHVVCASQ